MQIEYTVLDRQKAVLVAIRGHVGKADVAAFRARAQALADSTGFHNFIIDIKGLLSIARAAS